MRWSFFKIEAEPMRPTDDDPLFRRIRTHAAKRLNKEAMNDPKKRLFACKEYLRLEHEMLWRYHSKGDSGMRVTKAYSIMMDVLIQMLFERACLIFEEKTGKPAQDVCVLALGGYGRSELCPQSDIDIMFLCPTKMNARSVEKLQQIMVDEILYLLWDLKLKVGHSTRNYKEAIDEAKSSVESKNSMLEARLVCGSAKMFDKFQKNYRQFYLSDKPIQYAQSRLANQKDRRAKYGNTVYMQQPNIKNGVGGLRDFQNILWLSFVRLNAGTLEEIQEKGYLSASEVKKLYAAYDFLLRARNELHFRSTRPTDVLDLESQPDIAWGLGYKQHDIFKRMEAFMHDYFMHTSAIYKTSNLLERRLADSLMPGNEAIKISEVIRSREHVKRELFDGFIREGDSLTFETRSIFKDDPLRLIRVFRYAQQTKCEMTLDLIALIRDSLPLIDARVINSESANRTFRAILQEVGEVSPTLYHMHDCGVLGRFMPEFGRLTHLVQHEYYHLYTADIHTLRCIQELDDIFSKRGDHAERYLHEIRQTRLPGLLYLMLLLHDLGKADGIKGHAEAGIAIAKPILIRMAIPKEHHSQILFIIENHFEMARFTLNYDVDDPATAETFAKCVDTSENLRYLYVHTFCDARGTSHELWNSYKDAMLRQLLQRTLEQFKGQDHVLEQQKQQKEMIRKKLMEMSIPGISQEEVDAHFNLLTDRYFINHTEDEIIQHLKMVNQLLMKISGASSVGSLEPVIEWYDDLDRGMSIVHVVTWDRAGLFYKLAGAFALANLSILSSKVITRQDHITIDTFCVEDAKGGIVQSKRARDQFEETVKHTLLEGKELFKEISEKEKSLKSNLFAQKTQRLRANIPPVVDIYHELSLKRTIVEVQATDHIGLLYQISKAIFDIGFDINFARISTERDAALDVFYIENINRGESIEPKRLQKLKRELESIISDTVHEEQAAS